MLLYIICNKAVRGSGLGPTHTHIHTYTHVHSHIIILMLRSYMSYTHTHTHTYIHYMYAYTCNVTHIHTHAQTSAHTYTHAHLQDKSEECLFSGSSVFPCPVYDLLHLFSRVHATLVLSWRLRDGQTTRKYLGLCNYSS